MKTRNRRKRKIKMSGLYFSKCNRQVDITFVLGLPNLSVWGRRGYYVVFNVKCSFINCQYYNSCYFGISKKNKMCEVVFYVSLKT